jgi:hypothetical protein
MKGLQNVLRAVLITLGTAAPAMAQTGRQDNSGLFVWAFLGICAVIVAAQAIPAILMMIGTARAVAKKVKEGEPVPAESKVKSN